MALVLNYQSLGIQKSVNSCQVPENKLAKLMYYLECAFSTLDIRCDVIVITPTIIIIAI